MPNLKLTRRQPATAGAPAGPAAAAGAPAERVLTFGDVFGRDAGGLIVLLVLFGAMTLASDEFLTGDNLANLARQVAVFGIIAVGQLLVILADAGTVQPLPDSFANIANGAFLGLPNLLWMFVAVVVVASFVLRRTVFGRYVYAVGSNPESARLAGVPVTRVLVAVYAISGLLAAVGGVLFTSRLGAGVPTAGTGYELNAIAACVIGGASLFGAKGGAFGAAAGALIVGTLNNGGNLLAINSFYLQIIIGALILAAVAFDQWQGRRSRGS